MREATGTADTQPHSSDWTPEETRLWEERCQSRERREGLAGTLIVTLFVPLWTFFDRFLEPSLVGDFWNLRLAGAAIAICLCVLLWRSRRLHVTRGVTLALLVLTGPTIALMLPRVEHFTAYVFGLSLYFWCAGVLLSWPARYSFIGLGWLLAFLAGAFALERGPRTSVDVVWSLYYLGTVAVVSSVIGLMRRRADRDLFLSGFRLAAAHAKLEQANASLRQLSMTDPLTGLRNRRYVDLTIEEDLAIVRRAHRNLRENGRAASAGNVDIVFMLVDLDHFKQVNDRHGHAAGDRVLQQIRTLLGGCCRATDTVVRWGGEEFLLVLRQTDRASAANLAQRICDVVRANPFEIGAGQVLALTCSVGFAPYPLVPDEVDRVSWEKVVELADQCLYAAKSSGRNGWVGLTGLGSGPAAPLDGPLEVLARDGRALLCTSHEDPSRLAWR